MLYHLISQPEDILKKTNSTINQANVKLKEFNRSTSRYQKKKKTAKYIPNQVNSIKKKNPNLSIYINPNSRKNKSRARDHHSNDGSALASFSRLRHLI